MKDEHEQSDRNDKAGQIGDLNIERLIGRAYEPETLDKDFAARVVEDMLALARDEAAGRARRQRTLRLVGRGLLRWGPFAAAAAIMIALLVARMGTVERAIHVPGGEGVSAVARPPALKGFPASPAMMAGMLTARARPASRAGKPIAVGTAIRTQPRARLRAVLTDGSVLYVNQDTQVVVTGRRRLSLHRGEVYVEVQPEGPDLLGQPAAFVIQTPAREVVAVGTRLGVNVSRGETGVCVTQGKARVSGVAGLLHAGQQLRGNDNTPTTLPRATYVLDWTKDLMASAESPLVPKSRHAGGALVALDPNGQEMKLSLRKYKIDVHIEDGFARTTIDQTYFNHTQRRLEGTFYFPLPPDASLSRLAMYVEGKLNEGGMVERDRARAVYESIVYKMKDPALLEWVDGTTFKMRIFPLFGRREKRIILSYTQKLPVAYGRTAYRFPAGHSMQNVGKWSFRALIRDGAAAGWQCNSHELTEATKGRDVILTARAENVKPDMDVVLNLMDPGLAPGAGEMGVADGAEFSSAIHEASAYLMLRYRPNLPVVKRRPKRHWVFLFESSADRDPLLARAQIEVIRGILQAAEHDDTFALVTAGTRARVFFGSEGPIAASPDNIGAAMDFLDNTHLIGALDLGQALAVAGKLCGSADNAHLVHVGAGVPVLGARDEKSLLGRLPAGATYVGVGVGKRWSRSFMKAAAAATGGYYTQINPDENISWRAFELVSTLNTPRLLNVRVEAAPPWTGGEFLCHNDSAAHGEQICAILRVAKDQDLPRTVTVTGLLEGEEWSATAAVQNVAPKAGYLPRIWARLEIDRLLGEDPQKNHKKIVKLSKAMYVMSPFTSLLVLENEAMYKKYKVDRGRKDHWALYQCPKEIKVVHEPLRPATAPATRAAKKKPPTKAKAPWQKRVLDTVVVRVARPFFQPPAHRQAPPAVLGTVRAMAPRTSAAVTSAGLQAPPGMSVLKTDLPRARFIGTPKNIRADNFPPGGPKPDKPLFVPIGVENLAKGRAVTGSDDEPNIGELEYITDGDKEGQHGSFVELGPGKQHVQIDLGAVSEIFAVVVWHDHRTPQVSRDVVAQVSNDEHFIDKKTIFNNDHDNSSGLGLGKDYEWIETNNGKIMPVAGVKGMKGVKGRYVRLYRNGGTSGDENLYTEVEVYGRPEGGTSLQGLSGRPTSAPSRPDTDLLEALALAGRIPDEDNARYIYIMRHRKPVSKSETDTFLNDIQANFLIQATQAHGLSRVQTAPRITLYNGQAVYVNDQRPYVSNYVFDNSGSMRTGLGTRYGMNSYWEFSYGITPSLAREVNGDGIVVRSDGRWDGDGKDGWGFRTLHSTGGSGGGGFVYDLSGGTMLDVGGTISADRRYVTFTLEPQVRTGGYVYSTDVPDLGLTEVETNVLVPDGGTLMIGGLTGSGTFGLGPKVPLLGNIPFTGRMFTDSGTLLLGGLKQGAETDREIGVPLLNKIPILNPLFTNRGTARDDDTLLILVTPRILIQRELEEQNFPGGAARGLSSYGSMTYSDFKIAALTDRAKALMAGRRFAQALEDVDRVLALDPNSRWAAEKKETLEQFLILKGEKELFRTREDGPKQAWNVRRPVVQWWAEVTYARDWREITARRTKFGVPTGRESREDRRIRVRLKETIRQMNFDDIELKDAIQFFRDVSGVNIYVRWSTLEAAGITKATTVDVHLTDVSLEKALRVVLEDVGALAPMAYVVESGVISISTAADLTTRLTSHGGGFYQPDAPTMRVARTLYRRPKFTGQREFFTNLTVYAPGLNTTTVDILGALEADAPKDARPKAGSVDIEARKLIAAARAAGWQTVSLGNGSNKPGLVITLDGAGRYAYSRVCTGGLAERVICDGRRLLHLYEQIGLGAVRELSRFHRAELIDTIPWLVAPADDLAVGADISLKDQRTVAITPLGAKDRKTKGGKQAPYVEIHLVFTSQGRLGERQIFLMPKGKMIGRITYGADGLVKLLGGDQKVLSERKYEVKPAPAPNLKPDLSKLVLLPMPRRTLKHLERTRKLNRGTAATWSEADALAYVAATGPGQHRYLWGKEGVIERRFIKKGDRRMGFYVLAAERNRWPALAKELADHPLGKYLAALAKTAKTSKPELVGDAGKGFIGRLAGFHDLWYRVKDAKMHQTTPQGAEARDVWRDDVLAYVGRSGPDLYAWALLCEGQGLAGKWKDADGAARALDSYAKYPALRYIVRYEAARALCTSGNTKLIERGRERFKKLYGETLADGLLGAFDQSFYKATAGHGWKKLMRNAAGELVKKKARFAAVVLARQCQQVGDWQLGREVLTMALTGAPKRQELPLKLAAFAHYRRGKHWADADRTVSELLADKRLATSPWMWRAAADVAFKRGRTASAVQRLDRALDIEYRRLPEKVNVRAVRAAFGHLMGEYAKLCQAVATLEDEPPKKMLAGLVRTADRWRTLDVDPAPACHGAAKALRRLGANELAWDYLTTPLASKPNEAGPWVNLAAQLAGEGDVDLADKAYAAAFDIEPTNAQILWDRAQLLSRHGRGDRAAGIYRQISKGSWQPKHQSIKRQATEAMEQMKR